MTGSSFYSVEKELDGRSGGTTQAETRVYNERLVISLIRRHGQLSKVELTRLTGLSPQTITTIVNRIADNGLLLRMTPLRGRLGQPSVPYALNAEGAYSLGLKIDRRSADIAMINLVGEIVAFERTTFAFPVPADIMTFARAGIARIGRKHKSGAASRIAGLGIASPFHIWNWNEETEIPPDIRTAWQQVDIRAELDREFDWPVYLFNDAMIAAGAELMFGSGVGRADFLYIYIGSTVGGGLVLDHHLFPGRSKLAGMLGDMPVPAPNGGHSQSLKQVVSLQALASGLPPKEAEAIWASPEKWPDVGPLLAPWVERASEGLASAILSVVALLDVDNIIIDGAIPAEVRRNIARATRRRVSAALASRPEPFSILEGNYGHMAPAIGGASIPLLVKYSNDKDLLFKE